MFKDIVKRSAVFATAIRKSLCSEFNDEWFAILSRASENECIKRLCEVIERLTDSELWDLFNVVLAGNNQATLIAGEIALHRGGSIGVLGPLVDKYNSLGK